MKKTFWFIGAPYGYIPFVVKEILKQKGIPITFTVLSDRQAQSHGVIRVEEKLLLEIRHKVSFNVPLVVFYSQKDSLLDRAIFSRKQMKFVPL